MSFLLTLPVQGCSGGYPLPPTRCDEWCHATKGQTCQDHYDPASCVASCENADLDSEACRAQFDAVITCFRNSPSALEQRCIYGDAPDDCELESEALGLCLGAQFGRKSNG
jgi:hypothetical protein